MPAFDTFFTRLCSATPIQSQTELASHLGVNRSAVTQAKERDSVPERWVYRLARAFDLNPDWLSGEAECQSQPGSPGHPEVSFIPIVPARLNAEGNVLSAQPPPATGYTFCTQWLQSKGCIADMVLMPVHGDGMAPALLDGDTVLIDQSQQEIVSGGLFALGIHQAVCIKRLEQHPSCLALLSTNPAYSPIWVPLEDLGQSVLVLESVLWMCRDL